MKTLLKSILLAAWLPILGASIASADDSQLQNRLAVARQQAPCGHCTPTIAFYAGDHGVGQVQRATQGQQQSVWKSFQAGNGPIVSYQVPTP